MDFLTLAKEKETDFLADLNTLVSIESTRDETTMHKGAPFGENCRKALDAWLAMAERDGFKTENIDGYAGIVHYGQGEKSLGVLGHLDIVPVGDDWTKDPLKVTVNDGYVFGRGVIDDKGPSLAAYYALKILKEQGIEVNRRIFLITGCDEESGMECMDYYKQHAEIPDMGFVPDADFPVIYGEKGILHFELSSKDETIIESMHAGSRPNIVIGKCDCVLKTEPDDKVKELFSYYCKVHNIQGRIEGKTIHIDGMAAHASLPWLGVNAGLHMLNFVGNKLNDTLAKEYYSLLCDWQGKPLNIYKDGLYMSFLTMNTGIIDIENDCSKIVVDIRYPNDLSFEEITGNIQTACKMCTSGIEFRVDTHSAPLFVDPQSKLVKDLMHVYQKYTGDTFSPAFTLGGGTYARKFENFVSFGPVLPNDEKTTDQYVGDCHQRDEGFKLENLIKAIAIYAEAMVSLCNES